MISRTGPPDSSGLVARPDEHGVRFRSVADIARQWLLLDDPTHEAPQRDWSLPRGVLRRRPVRGAVELTDVVGKEGAKIDAGPLALILDDEDLTSTFLESDEWYSLVLPVLIAAREARIASESSVPRGTVRYTLEGRSPSPEHYRILVSVADRIATAGLVSANGTVSNTLTGRLSAWLSLAQSMKRLCDGCGPQLVGRQQQWCAECRWWGHRKTRQDS